MAEQYSTIKEMLNSFSDLVVERAQRNIGATRTVTIGGKSRKRKIDSSGQLRTNLNYKLIGSGPRFVIQYGAKGEAGQYADVVDKGRRPGTMPPPMAIRRWIDQKPIRLRNDKGGFIKSTEKQKARLAFQIADAIKRRGIPATNFYTDAFEEELANAGPEFIEELKREITLALALGK